MILAPQRSPLQLGRNPATASYSHRSGRPGAMHARRPGKARRCPWRDSTGYMSIPNLANMDMDTSDRRTPQACARAAMPQREQSDGRARCTAARAHASAHVQAMQRSTHHTDLWQQVLHDAVARSTAASACLHGELRTARLRCTGMAMAGRVSLRLHGHGQSCTAEMSLSCHAMHLCGGSVTPGSHLRDACQPSDHARRCCPGGHQGQQCLASPAAASPLQQRRTHCCCSTVQRPCDPLHGGRLVAHAAACTQTPCKPSNARHVSTPCKAPT